MIHNTVDTFEHDVANEIRQKEASIADIASAVGDIGNLQTETSSDKNHSMFIGIVIILIICGIVGVGYVLYYSYKKTPAPSNATLLKNNNELQQKKNQTQLATISQTLNKEIGQFVSNVEKTSSGYNIEISSYSPVFSYMIKNENKFADEIAQAVGNTRTIKTNPKVTTIAPVAIASSTATSTQTTSTSTATTTEIQPTLPMEYIFSDVTISNQNMRIATSVYGTVVYAFIGTQRVVISQSTEGILQLRNNIIRK